MASIRSHNRLRELRPTYAIGFRRLLAALIDLTPFLILANALLRGPVGDAFPSLPVSELPLFLFPYVLFGLPLWLFHSVIWGESTVFIFLGEATIAPITALLIATPTLAIFEAISGRTPGKFLMRLRVVDGSGNNPTFKQLATRNIIRVYDFTVGWLFLYVLILWDILVRRPLPGWASGAYRFAWSESGQRWGDELAGTYVIRGRWNPVRLGSGSPASSREQRGIRLSGRG